MLRAEHPPNRPHTQRLNPQKCLPLTGTSDTETDALGKTTHPTKCRSQQTHGKWRCVPPLRGTPNPDTYNPRIHFLGPHPPAPKTVPEGTSQDAPAALAIRQQGDRGMKHWARGRNLAATTPGPLQTEHMTQKTKYMVVGGHTCREGEVRLEAGECEHREPSTTVALPHRTSEIEAL